MRMLLGRRSAVRLISYFPREILLAQAVGPSTPSAPVPPKLLHLVIYYGQKVAQIQLPAGAPRSAEEQKGNEPHGRELRELLVALQEVVDSATNLIVPLIGISKYKAPPARWGSFAVKRPN
jgi:hypothetical protein